MLLLLKVMPSSDHLQHWLSLRVRMACIGCFVIGSLLPPYVSHSAIPIQEGPAVNQQQFLLVEDGFLMKSSSLTRYGARRAYTQGRVHIVKEGETIETLATRYDLNLQTILWANSLQRGATIYPGDELLILPVDGILHNVKRGQTLLGIAQLYEVEPQDIIERNDLNSSYILAGQELIVPGGKPIVSKPTTVASAQLPPTTDKPTTKPTTQEPPTAAVVDIAPAAGTPNSDITYGVLQKPCSAVCSITQYYRAGHYALDLQEKGGGPIYAAEAGTVTRSDFGWNGGYGNVIEIDHGNGLVTLYSHNKEHVVPEGALVARGQHIANMGNTGRVYGQTGIHVHFEVRVNGVKKNPLIYLQ